jgi:hypothetical protein
MTPKRRSAPAPAAMACAAVLLALGLLILTLARPGPGRGVRAAAATLAARGEASNASSPGALLSVLRGAAPSGDTVHVTTTDGTSIGEPLKAGLWTTAVTPLHARAAGVDGVQLSQAGVGGGLGLAREVLIVAAVLALLGLMAAYGSAVRARARDRRRPQTAKPARHQASRVRTEHDSANGDRQPLVSALMVVVDTMPDSPAGVRALRTLKQVGVELIEPPPGAPFDPLLHSVCGVVQAPDQGLVDSIAAVVRPGLADHGSVLREADVQVYGSASEKTRAVPAIS